MPDTDSPAICCIGGMTLDRTLYLQHPPVPGTANPVTSRRMRGGVARNVAENLVRLSTSCSLVSIVGNDDAGRSVLFETARQGVETGLVQKSLSQPTGSCTTVIGPDGEMSISFADMGICDAMDRGFIRARWLQVRNARLVFVDTNLPAESLSYLITGCRENSLTLVVNTVSTYKARRLPLNLNGVDMLVCNRAEARAMLGDDMDKDLEGMAKAICRRGAASAVITAGADGICFARGGRCICLPARARKIVNVTGAGDALVSGLIYGRLNEYEPVASLHIGLNAAALTLGSAETNCPDLSVETVTRGIDPSGREVE